MLVTTVTVVEAAIGTTVVCADEVVGWVAVAVVVSWWVEVTW